MIIANVYSLANGNTNNENEFIPCSNITNLRGNSVFQNEKLTNGRKEVKLNIPEFNKVYEYRRSYDDPTFKCLNCKATFKNLRNFASHHYGSHPNRQAMYFCNVCKQACGLNGKHIHHACHVCGAYFLDKGEVAQHIRIMHVTELHEFNCKYCKKIFSAAVALSNHIKFEHTSFLQFEEQ